jgi:ribulose-bisphosphate carboxylase small chain
MAAICASICVPCVAAPAKASLARPAAAKAPAPRVANLAQDSSMLVWTPTDNKFFETFSFLPPLTNQQVAKQVDYIVNNGFIPSLEFANAEQAYVASDSCIRLGTGATPNYADNRYWTMYKLPMFGCTDPSQVLNEISNCTRSFPDAYIRLVAFDQVRQVQCAGFLVHRPPSAREFQAPNRRSI